MLTGLTVSYLSCKCAFYRSDHNAKGGGGTPWSSILKFLKWENEIYQRIELKENMKKMRSFFYLSCLIPELWSLKCRKWLIF